MGELWSWERRGDGVWLDSTSRGCEKRCWTAEKAVGPRPIVVDFLAPTHLLFRLVGDYTRGAASCLGSAPVLRSIIPSTLFQNDAG